MGASAPPLRMPVGTHGLKRSMVNCLTLVPTEKTYNWCEWARQKRDVHTFTHCDCGQTEQSWVAANNVTMSNVILTWPTPARVDRTLECVTIYRATTRARCSLLRCEYEQRTTMLSMRQQFLAHERRKKWLERANTTRHTYYTIQYKTFLVRSLQQEPGRITQSLIKFS